MLIFIGQTGILAGIVMLSIYQAEQSRILREQAEQAEASNKTAQNFLTTMSHELRTPIHTIRGFNELLQQTAPDPQQQTYLQKQETALKHMLGLIGDVLDLAKMNNGHYEILNNQSFELESLLDELKNLMSFSAQQKGLQLLFQTPWEKLPQLSGDPERLRQILINLLSNAIKYTDRGRVSLTLSITDTQADKLRMVFSVRDTGIGISGEQQKQIFSPFYQADAENRTQRGGSGLGLSITRKLLQSMGSQLEFSSTSGVGSRFFFTLELPKAQKQTIAITKQTTAPAPPQTATEPVTQSLPLQGYRILLVDDDPLNRLIGKEYLLISGAVVTLAESGRDAIKTIRQHIFDLVFMDINMPGINGYAATQQIRADKNFRQLPIVALTAHALAGEKERCLAAGMNGYMTKPFRINDIVSTAQRYILTG
jgi:CheY-like chemotaxis protein